MDKEAKYVEARLQGKNKQQSAMIATGVKDKKVANVYAHRLERKPDVRKQINKAIKKRDITIDKLINVYAEAMQAVKVVIIGKGEDAFADPQPDHVTRMKAADKFMDLMGIKGQAKTENTTSHNIAQRIPANLDEVELSRAVFRKSE